MRRDDRQRELAARARRSPRRARRRRRGPRAALRGSSGPGNSAAHSRAAFAAPAALPCSSALADVAVARAGQRDQAVGAFGEPLAAQLGAAAMLVGRDTRATASRRACR